MNKDFDEVTEGERVQMSEIRTLFPQTLESQAIGRRVEMLTLRLAWQGENLNAFLGRLLSSRSHPREDLNWYIPDDPVDNG